MGKKRNSKKRSSSIDQAATCAIQDLATSREDLSMQCHDEETALSAILIYDDTLVEDFSSYRKKHNKTTS